MSLGNQFLMSETD